MDFNQRPACEIVPPAIARHVVFRLHMSENPRWLALEDDRRAAWTTLCRHLSEHVNALRDGYKNSRRAKITPPHGGTKLRTPRFSAERTCVIPITKRNSGLGYRLRVRVDLHTELFSFTYLFDRIDPHGSDVLCERIASLPVDLLSVGWLFDEAWTSGDMPAGAEISSWLDNASGSRRRYGALITDFRGIILCPRDPWTMTEPSLTDEEIRREPGKELHEDLIEFTRTGEKLIRAIADPGGGRASEIAGGEAVVCGMLQGKALYAAQLGQWGRGVAPIQPVRHLLVYAGRSPAQLGRLIRRMHVLGELRHAALMDWDREGTPTAEERAEGIIGKSLRDVSRELRVLGQELNERTREITLSGTPMTQLQGFVVRMATISRMVDGGLTYRLEQSRYYAAEFQQAVEHLRLVRLSDWQPYDDFVKRYVLHLFARIHRIGNRYEALGRRVDRLLFYKQAQLLEPYTTTVSTILDNIRDATGELRTSAANQTVAAEKQIHLLKVAEAFAAVFLIYYAGSVFLHLFEREGERGPVVDERFLYAWAVLMGFFATRLVLRLVHNWMMEEAPFYRRRAERLQRWRTERRQKRQKTRAERRSRRSAKTAAARTQIASAKDASPADA